MDPTQCYTEHDVLRWYSGGSFSRAKGYLTTIWNLSIGPAHIIASVQGTQRRPYQVEIQFNPSKPTSAPRSRCTCPMEEACKHTVAVLLKALTERKTLFLSHPTPFTRPTPFTPSTLPAPLLPPEVFPSPPIHPDILSWADSLRTSLEVTCPDKKAPKNGIQLHYFLEWRPARQILYVHFAKGKVQQKHLEKQERWNNVERALLQPPKFLSDADEAILRRLWSQRDRSEMSQHGTQAYRINGPSGHEIMEQLLQTGRVWFKTTDPAEQNGFKLGALGPPRSATLVWEKRAAQSVQPKLHTDPACSYLVPLSPVWYIDLLTQTAGPVELKGINIALAHKILSLPPLSSAESVFVSSVVRTFAPQAPLPNPSAIPPLRVITCPVVPVLKLATRKAKIQYYYRNYLPFYGMGKHNFLLFDYAQPFFRYEDSYLPAHDPSEFKELPSGEVVHIKRHAKQEAAYLKSLSRQGLEPLGRHVTLTPELDLNELAYGLSQASEWPGFMQTDVPELKRAGWEIQYTSDFRHIVLEVEHWEADVHESQSGWFDIDMGIVVEGQRLPLAPLLSSLFEREPRWLNQHTLEQMPEDEPIRLITPEGRIIQVPAKRLKLLARTLIDLFDGFSGNLLRISQFDAPRLAALSDMGRWQFKGLDAILAMAKRLLRTDGIQPVPAPKDFGMPLRPYQEEGLAWLQYLRQNALCGLLADDMGLGKTAQTLAHILHEKQAQRLKHPALIVLPTSLLFNWKQEAARFTPTLSVLSLQGNQRKEQFEAIPQHDVVLTTYPLLWRDETALLQYSYHLLILDEAHTVKNVQSRGADVVRKLKATHRLCLTGTPLENHLGELWTQFDFLLPGFLGSLKDFTQTWRTPIEKQGNLLRRELLAKRLKPFILRRRKEEVAKELPPKTLIVRNVVLEGGQRDLYETVRSVMDAKVREAIATQGFKRSQIMILDALLKLRQVCCDPRLLKSAAAQKVPERAKLDVLMTLLPNLIEEGRRILIFSQFTSMLALIEIALKKAKLPYVMLTGQTKDRETPIQHFQKGEVPLFLISLKAGGVGLNLTQADTVIHYDPWWNPAVENQATDRAHRLGQTKPVFVYKLIVSGSIEERILVLQEKKAALAQGILSEDKTVEVKFTEEDLKALFTPLPD